MSVAPDFPTVPAGKLDGWTLVEESVETVFRLPAVRVVGATRQYEDEQLRETVRTATDGDVDHRWRFFAATRLGFDPSLPPGTTPSLILPMVRSEAKKMFKKRLADRGITGIERFQRERVRVRSGNRARLTRYDGTDPIAGGIPVTGWVGVWNDGTDFLVVTGGYPSASLADAFDSSDELLGQTASAFRDELLDLLRDVE